MSRRIMLVIALLAACIGSALSATTPAALPSDPVAIPAALFNTSGAAAFSFNPTLLTGAAATAAIKSYPGAGMSSGRTATQLPGIAGSGLSQTYFELEPCALRAAHTHMRASGLLYAINANSLAVAFVLADGPAVVNTVTTGASTVFPQGLMHYQQNMDCLNSAKYLITYNSENPGTQNSVNALFELPPDAIQASLGIDRAQLLALADSMAMSPIYQNITSLCHQQCKLVGATTLKAEVPITSGFEADTKAPVSTGGSNVYGRKLRSALGWE